MILLVSDRSEAVREIETALKERGIGVTLISTGEFDREEIKGKGLVIYHTEDLNEGDVVNITMAKKEGIPLVLVIPYLSEDRLKEVSRLWKGGYLKDCLIKPIKMKDLLKYIPQGH